MSLEMIINMYMGTKTEAPIATGLRAGANAGDCCDVGGDCSNCD